MKMPDELSWGPYPDPTPEQLEVMARGVAAYIVETALKNGTCIACDMHTEGDGNRDLVISLRVRHNSSTTDRA